MLLAENRVWGLDTNGYGTGVNFTNALAPTQSGTYLGDTNVIDREDEIQGTLLISYNFFQIPDDLRSVHYDGARIFDSGGW